jgi:hypothetical protein
MAIDPNQQTTPNTPGVVQAAPDAPLAAQAPTGDDNAVVSWGNPPAAASASQNDNAVVSWGNPQQQQAPNKTGLENFEDELNKDTLANPAITHVVTGAVKSAATGLGGIIDLIKQSGQSSRPTDAIDPKRIAQLYSLTHPGASAQQVAAYTNSVIQNPHTAPSKTIMDMSAWLHQGQQPSGFWEQLGSLGEQALEWIGPDAVLKMTTAPAKAAKAGEVVSQVADSAAHIKQAGQVASFLKANPKLAGLITVGLKAAKDALGTGAQNYLHNEDTDEALKAGAFGGLVSAPIHAVGAAVSHFANEAEDLLPKNVPLDIPSQEFHQPLNPVNLDEVVKDTVPVSAVHPEAADQTTTTGKFLQGAATKKGAFDFTEQHVQPAATKAAQDNFADVAKTAVGDLHEAQGIEHAPEHPTLNTVDEAAKYMQGEAKKTYTKLDEAAQPEVDAWEAQYGKGVPKGTPNVNVLGPDGQPLVGDHHLTPITAEGEPIPEKPKLFTELQDQINGAKDTISNPGESQVDKQKAIQDLPKFEQEMKDFLTKHGDVVDQAELDKANQVYAKSKRFEWVADKIRQATRGAGQGSVFKGDIQSLSPKSLESLPRQYDTRFGEGSFLDLLGTKGYRNYNDVVNAMKNPKTGSMFFEWLKSVPFGFGKVLGSIPAGAVADKILFDPVVGEKIVNGFKKFAAQAEAAAKAPGVAASGAGAFNKPKAQSAYAGISSDLGGK